jgi:hypothetical protein
MMKRIGWLLLVLYFAICASAAEPPSPWETAVRIHTRNGMINVPGEGDVLNGWDGSGTVIRATDSEATVLTCAHIFLDRKKTRIPVAEYKAEVMVDLFDGMPVGYPQEMTVAASVPAKVIDFDHDADLGLIRMGIKTGRNLPASPLALNASKLKPGQRVRVSGCRYGGNASVLDAEITRPAVTGSDLSMAPRYLGIECRVAPASGRSGGGLFDRNDHLIGVVTGHRIDEDLGYYAHPTAIRKFLIKNGILKK